MRPRQSLQSMKARLLLEQNDLLKTNWAIELDNTAVLNESWKTQTKVDLQWARGGRQNNLFHIQEVIMEAGRTKVLPIDSIF